MNRTTLLALLVAGSALVCGCAQKEQAATAQPQNAYQPATDPRETATPQDTLEELSHQSITVLDLGVYLLRKEVIPDIDKRLRSTGLLPPGGVVTFALAVTFNPARSASAVTAICRQASTTVPRSFIRSSRLARA